MDKQTLEFNVNYEVFVKLTDTGREKLRIHYEDQFADIERIFPIYTAPEYIPPEEDADGWSRWQLWELMSKLGWACGNGLDVPFETAIRIPMEIATDAQSGEYVDYNNISVPVDEAIANLAQTMQHQLDTNATDFGDTRAEEVIDSYTFFTEMTRGTFKNWIKTVETAGSRLAQLQKENEELKDGLAKYEDALGCSDFEITMATGKLDEEGNELYGFPRTILLTNGEEFCGYTADSGEG